MKKANLIMLSAGAIALSVAAYAAVPVLEKVQSLDNTEIRHLDGTAFHAPQRAMSLPYLIEPTREQTWQCVTFDLNNDYRSWENTPVDDSYCFYISDPDHNADDWVILPAVNLPHGSHRISCDYLTDSFATESFSVAIGTEANPDAMTQTVLDCQNVRKTDDFTQVSNKFFVENEGTYYVGLYCNARLYNSTLYVKNVAIENIDPARPEPPAIESIDFTSIDGTITIKAPGEKVNGETLGSTPMSLDVYIDGDAVQGSPFSISPGTSKNIDLTLSGDVHTVSTSVSYIYNGYRKVSDTASREFRVTRIMEIPMTLPAYIIPDEDQFGACTVIDANNNGDTWQYLRTSGYPFSSMFRFYSSNAGYNCNDWLIFPAMLRGDSEYFELNYDVTNPGYINYDVYVASEPTAEAMLAGELISEGNIIPTPYNGDERSLKFKYSGSDTFCIGIHLYDVAYFDSMSISNVEVKPYDGASPKSPVFAEFSFDGGDGEVILHLPRLCFDETTINSDKVTVNLSIDGEDVSFATGAPGATVSIPVTGLTVGEHTFTATSSYIKDGATLIGETATATHQIQKPSSFSYTIPLDINFTSAETAYDFDIINDNNDYFTWWFSEDLGLSYSCNYDESADDWAILTVPVLIENASNSYRITLNATTCDYWQSFAVYFGSEPSIDKMNYSILHESGFNTPYNIWADCSNTFKVQKPGKYYLGIRCLSERAQATLSIRSMKIEIATTNEDPGIVEELTATPDPAGQLNATISFKMPTLNRGGEEMAADTQLTATVSSSVDTKTVTGVPGQNVSTSINTVKGKNTISVTVENSIGQSDKTTEVVYCGLDTPKAPVITSTATSKDGLSAILTWDPVTEGIHDGYVQNVKYRVFALLDQTTGSWSEGEVTTNTTYEFRVPEGTRQELYTLGVVAFIYEGVDSPISQTDAVVGQPYKTDVTEVFANNKVTYHPIYTDVSPQSTFIPEWMFDFATNYWPDAAIPDQMMLIGRTYRNTGDCKIMLPLVETTGAAKVNFSVDVYYDSAITPDMTVYAQTFGSERILVGELESQPQAGWHTYTFTLPEEMLNRQWVQMSIVTDFANAKQFALIKGYKMTAKKSDGVEDLLAGKVSVLASRGNIAINGAEGKDITVSDLAGKVLYSTTGESNGIVIPAAKGVHIVRIDNKAYKVMVK